MTYPMYLLRSRINTLESSGAQAPSPPPQGTGRQPELFLGQRLPNSPHTVTRCTARRQIDGVDHPPEMLVEPDPEAPLFTNILITSLARVCRTRGWPREIDHPR